MTARLFFPLFVGKVVGVDRGTGAPEVQHEREPDPDFSGRDDDDEQGEALPGVGVLDDIGRHQDQMDAAEHEFGGGELHDGVPSGEDPVEPDREQPRGDEVPDQWMHGASTVMLRSVVRGHMASSWPREVPKVQR
ncbi:hypothetical protein GCM10028833_15560 [Glycomyces tarimensis]